jgi:hypothetical protein
MMDNYSNFQAPSREEAAEEVLIEVQKIKPGNHLSVCREVVDAMPSLGSLTGWNVFFKKDAIQLVLRIIS